MKIKGVAILGILSLIAAGCTQERNYEALNKFQNTASLAQIEQIKYQLALSFDDPYRIPALTFDIATNECAQRDFEPWPRQDRRFKVTRSHTGDTFKSIHDGGASNEFTSCLRSSSRCFCLRGQRRRHDVI